LGGVAGGEADAGGFVVFFGGECGPGYGVAGAQGEGADEFALGAAVAFAEGMDGVDLAEVVGGALGEGVWVEALEMALIFEGGEEGFE